MARNAVEATLSQRQRQVVERIERAPTEPASLVERCRVVLMSADAISNEEQAKRLGVDRQRVRRWRGRWVQAQGELTECEAIDTSADDLEAYIRAVLADRPQSGTPPTFEPEQVAALIALACEDPEASGLPVSHWTPSEVAGEAIRRGIVERISPRHVDRLLAEAALRPHKTRYWLTSPDKREEPQTYQENVETVCETYREAPRLHEEGARVVCVDEKTGIQALKRRHPTKPPRPGLAERREFEYTRHGTQCLFANFEVATGRVISPTLSDTRTEDDFTEHIRRTIDSDPEGCWVFVVDQLNTHLSASLVELVARRCGITEDLGRKGRCGHLASKSTRKGFLQNPEHRIRFVYTPRHCSWLNQVEVWFSVLTRRLLRRASFVSKKELRERVLRFIDYFNAVLARPYRWTYTGRPLAA